jgi:hypothetical protein
MQASEEAQAQTQGKESSPDTIPHDILNRSNLKEKNNNLEVLL